MSPSHLSPSQGGSATPAPTEEIWVLRKPFAGTASWHRPGHRTRTGRWLRRGTATPWCPLSAGLRALTASPLRAGGDRSSLGSTGSVASARSSGSGQSAGSGAHALHAGSEGVKVRRAPRRPCQLLLAAVLQRLLPALTSAGIGLDQAARPQRYAVCHQLRCH